MRFDTGLRRQLLIGGALAAMLTMPALASAQEAAPGAAPEDVTGLSDIVVTATKRETSLQKTPISISVVNQEMIKDRHVQSLFDLADGGVPSLRVTTFEARQSALTIGIRGIVPLDANQPAREQGVGVYIDGVYLGRQHGLNAALFDTERVEVLKGPQGTLFGRNTEGGALSIVTKAPSGKFGGRFEGGFGNLGAYSGAAHVDLPEFHNFSVKVDAVKQYQGPTTKNPLEGQTGWGYYDRIGGRIAVRWQPFEGITNDFAFDKAKDKNSPFYSQLLAFNPYGCAAGPQSASPNCVLPGTNYTSLTGAVRPVPTGVVTNGKTLMRNADIGVVQQPSVDKTFGVTNNFKWKIAPELELRSITAWRGVNVEQWDNAGGAHRPPVYTPGSLFSRYSLANLRQRQFSQELQAVGSISNIDYVAGLFYFNERVSDDAATPSSNRWNADANGDGQPDVGADGLRYTINPAVFTSPFATIDRASAVRSRSYAVYGQATWHATDALHITAGGRYTKDKKHGDLLIAGGVNYQANPALGAARGYAPLDRTWNRFDPMVTVAYDLSTDVHVYAKYASGYRAGGASSRTINYLPFDPESVKSYEAGIKADFWDRRARFNLTGYIMDRKDSQVDINSFLYFGTSTFNNLETINLPGKAKIRGIEADLTVRPVEGLTLNASYAYTYTKLPLTPITYSVRNAAGVVTDSTTVNQQFYVVFTPRNAASGSIDYAVPVGSGDTTIRFHFDGNYAQATQTFDAYARKNDSSLVFNGRISLADINMGDGDQKLTVGVWGRNLFNTAYVYRRDPTQALPAGPTSTNVRTGSIANVLGEYGNFNMPRTYGVEATIKF
ncbi:TonB-dependent receptor [Sphingomonas crocodyli]|uniref:TonB-dependent receptor n=1 Tax=Sphingomonas crocodyli TaxID=1979270 RepID=A0A437M017_9SPHN|nr:TonB-dependent receptor [Sphingomonas crocodyli]RVT90854.1 TonB-dependent receptor [Sphingomonas crocodyli]